jgi:site-specific DNA recombinase
MVSKSAIENEIRQLQSADGTKLDVINRHFQLLTDIPQIYRKANVHQKHTIIRTVFKDGLMFNDGAYRTPYLIPALSHNQLILKEKGLLFVEESFANSGVTPVCSEDGN